MCNTFRVVGLLEPINLYVHLIKENVKSEKKSISISEAEKIIAEKSKEENKKLSNYISTFQSEEDYKKYKIDAFRN